MQTGLKAEKAITVTEGDTAAALGSGLLEVFSTPSLAALMENVCMECVRPYLDDGCGTVGISLNLQHTSATPVGMKVYCSCILTEVLDRKLVFDVTARDECGEIGHAVHERFIIRNESFMNKAQAKLNG